MRTCLLIASLLAICITLVPLAAADKPAADQPAAAPDLRALKDLTPDSFGKVRGRVYDAVTGIPIVEARVVVQDKGVFAESGDTTDLTGPTGGYECRGKIGRYRSQFSMGRALMGGLAGLLSGSARNVSKKVDVSVLRLRVTKAGYKPFEGLAACTSADAAKFAVYLEPILLVPEGGEGISTQASGWGAVRVLSVEVAPDIARPGDQVTVTANLRTPRSREHTEIGITCYSPLGSKAMKPVDPKAEGEVVYRAVITVPKKAKPAVGRAEVLVTTCPYDLGTQMSGSALLQVATTPEEGAIAEKRRDAASTEQAGSAAQAQALLKEVVEAPQATPFDCRWLATLSEAQHDYDTAIFAWQRLLALIPKKEQLLVAGDYARSLIAANQPARVLSEVEPMLAGLKKKDYALRVGPDLGLALATAYLRQGNLQKADEWHQEIVSWKGTANLPGLDRFRGELRLAKAKAAMESAPGDARAVLGYGRVLMDLGRWDEAVSELERCLALDPSLGAARWDLAYARQQAEGKQGMVTEGLEAALAEAEAAVEPTRDNKQPKDFFAFHRLGILLLRKARAQQMAGDPQAEATLRKCEETLYQALRLGRAATTEQENYNFFYGYTGPKVNTTAGWAYPEAAADFSLIDALQSITDHPDDYLGHYSLASALLALGQWDLVQDSLQRVEALRPDFSEIRFAWGTVAMRLGDNRVATRHLKDLVKVNPRHPQANLMLAQLHAQEGDMAAAAACLARHAECYGRQGQAE